MRYFIAILLMGLIVAGNAHATTITEVTSKGGIKAWLVEDHKLPLIAAEFAFRGGVEQDPVDKQGLAHLTMGLLTEGAGAYDAATFQQEMADHSIILRFGASRDVLMGSVKCLSEEKAKAFELLHLAVTAPHFDKSEVERLRSQQLSGLKGQLGNPDWQARYALFSQIFATHPYGFRSLGSIQSLSSLTEKDIKGFAAAHLAQDNLVIAVAGDITPVELAPLLDQVFGQLPKKAQLAKIGEVVWPAKPATILVPREGTQTEFLFTMPGPKREDPDWYAAEIADYILGSGGFSSRLMHDVRDEKGLTYDIHTGLSPMDYAGVLIGEAAADNDKVGQAWAIALETMRGFYKDGATDKEIASAKDYLTGALPLVMTSTDKIAGVLVDLQLKSLPRDYLDHRNDYLRNVTKEDVTRVIHKWFNPDGLTLSMVGKPDGMKSTETKDLVHN